MARSFSGDVALRYVLPFIDVMFAQNWPYGDNTVAASDVIASPCAGYNAFAACVVLVASCPSQRWASRLDESIMKGVPGAESAMHYCVVCNVTYIQCLGPPPIVIVKCISGVIYDIMFAYNGQK